MLSCIHVARNRPLAKHPKAIARAVLTLRFPLDQGNRLCQRASLELNLPAMRPRRPSSWTGAKFCRAWSPRNWTFIANTAASCRNSLRASICGKSFRSCEKPRAGGAHVRGYRRRRRDAWAGTDRIAAGRRDLRQSPGNGNRQALGAGKSPGRPRPRRISRSALAGRAPELPAVCLIVSGGHTLLYHVLTAGANGGGAAVMDSDIAASGARATMRQAKPMTRWRDCWRWAIPAGR